MPQDQEDQVIFEFTDWDGDTLSLEHYMSTSHGPVAQVIVSRDGFPWLTLEASKRLRKALKQWERDNA